MSEYMIPIPSRVYNAAVGGHVAGADQIIDDKTGLTLDKVTGGALEEKEYTLASNNGMGRVVLRKNIVNGVNTLTQNMINKSNTIYVIQYDFSLGNKKNYQGDIVVPDNSIILFEGGSLFSGNLVLGNNSRIENGIFDDATIFVHGSYTTIKNCKFTNKNNVSRSHYSDIGYVIRAGAEDLTTDVNHLTIDGCYIEDSINIPISIDDFVNGSYKCNYFTCCNCVIKHTTAGITLMGRNASRNNIHAEIYNNSIYFIGNDNAPNGFSISVESYWEHVFIHDNYLEGLVASVEIVGANNIVVENNEIVMVTDFSARHTIWGGIWLSDSARYDGKFVIINNNIRYLNTIPTNDFFSKNAPAIDIEYPYTQVIIEGNICYSNIILCCGHSRTYMQENDTVYLTLSKNRIISKQCPLVIGYPNNSRVTIAKMSISSSKNVYHTTSHNQCVSIWSPKNVICNFVEDYLINSKGTNTNFTYSIYTFTDYAQFVDVTIKNCLFNGSSMDNIIYNGATEAGSSLSKGASIFNKDLNKQIYWDGTKWLDATGVIADTPTSGTFANKPTVSVNKIPIGFKYFCTDKQTTEGATDGIEIIHKGEDVWVDALGRVVS